MNPDLNLIGSTGFIKKLRKDLPQLAKLDRLLLVGERGTGKSMTARLIQEISKSKLFTLNSSSSDESLIRETFEKTNSNVTILIQEIEEFSFLNQGIIAQLINSLPKKITSRVIISAKKNIAELKDEGIILDSLVPVLKKFDKLELPSLHERAGDIPLLVEHFIKNACENVGTTLKVIDINALDFLVRREWKGNILELKSVIEKSVLTSESETIELPEYLANEYAQLDGIMSNIKSKVAFPFDKSLSNLEKTLIEKTLEAVSNHQTKAARILNITPQNLRYRLKKFKIQI